MMLTFEIKLSFAACQILMMCVRYTDYYDSLDAKGRANKDQLKGKWGEIFKDDTMGSHFVSQARQLDRNGLTMESDKNHLKWLVTPKGRLVAELVMLEFEEARKEMRALGMRVAPQLKK